MRIFTHAAFDASQPSGLTSGTPMHRLYACSHLLVSLAAGAALCVCVPAISQQPHHPKGDPKRVQHAHIEQLEQQWRDSELNADVAAMDQLLSDDFLGITANGEVNTKQQFLDRMRDRTLTLSTLDMSEQKIKLVGQVAIVTSLAQVNGTSDGQPLTGRFRYTRVYQRLPGDTWRVTNFEATRIPPRRPGPGSPPASQR
jgi:ketosteroid isomerase-like protein